MFTSASASNCGFLLSIFVSFGHPVSIQLCDAASAICSLQESVLIIDCFQSRNFLIIELLLRAQFNEAKINLWSTIEHAIAYIRHKKVLL